MNSAKAELTCEVCGNALEKKEDMLCSDCSRAFLLVLELLRDHPDLAAEDLQRANEVFQWRMKKYGLLKPEVPQTTVENAPLLGQTG